MTLSCFERALTMADDAAAADVWYNVSNVAVGIGDLGLAYQACKVAVSVDGNHGESFNNLGVLELRKRNLEQARASFDTAAQMAPHLFEPAYNGALLAYKVGDLQQSFELTHKAKAAFDGHTDTDDLLKQLTNHFEQL